MGLDAASALRVASDVREGRTSAEAVTTRALDAIRARDAELGAFLTVQGAAAIEAARRIDQRRARGEELGRLAGVPVAVKDAIVTADGPTTAGSRILLRRIGEAGPDPRDGFVSPYEATCIERLRAEDAVIVGKTNLDEFAMGSSTENSAFFPTRNPRDTTRIPGGSSGGSAVAVAAGLCPIALGSDTGGSIRQPAALSGVVGVKPTYGRVSRFGLVAFASSLDQIGVFANDASSAAAALEVIAGHDPRDATSAPDPVAAWQSACDRDVRGLRIGVPAEYFGQGVEPGVEERVRAAIDRIAALGASVREVSLPTTRFAVATYYVLCTAEASSNLARYDGVRYGLRVPGADLRQTYERTRGAGFGPEVKRRIILGTFVLSAGYYDAYYLRAQRARTLIRRDFERVFSEVDALLAPTSPTVAFPLGERVADPLSMYLADVCTLPASLAGLPAASVPCGVAAPPGGGPPLPVGLQIMAPPFEEARVFTLAARALEGTPP